METKTTTTHVMLVDDDGDDRFIFDMAIKELTLPFKIWLTTATNGENLMRILNEQIPDILFLDIRMPIKNGIQCLKEIRADRKYDVMVIVIYSAMNDYNTIETCYLNGSNFFALKPTSIKDLIFILNQILTQKQKSPSSLSIRSEFVLKSI